MTKTDLLTWLESWYESQCDGDWEHAFGVSIDTLDNPGWTIKVDLDGTELEDQEMVPIREERSPLDWVHCWVKHRQFHGAGGPQNLREILTLFRDWAQTVST